MLDEAAFFDALERQYDNKLPFVVYSRPINSIIKSWLQRDDDIHTTDTFTESGFVFAPFDFKNPTILIPQEKSVHQVLEVHNLEIQALEKRQLRDRTEAKATHISLVSEGIQAIQDNSLQKVVLTRVEEQQVPKSNPLNTFKHLFNTYKNAMVYCWYHPKVGLWLGATPELLFKLEGQELTAISLAGTQAYSDNSEPKWSTKELKEQQIVTDYLASQVAPYTTETVVSEVETIRAGNLWHLKTRLISRLAPATKLKSIIQALHPTPAVCGFPKQKAKDFILEHEGYDRKYYTGFLGELNLKQIKTRNTNSRNVENNAYAFVKTQSNFYVNLRCMQLKAGKAFVYVGGGITEDSIPEKEWEETCYKAKTIGNILG